MSPLLKNETHHEFADSFLVMLSLNHYSFSETMSQVLWSKPSLTEIDLRSPNQWFEHTQFGNLLVMVLVLASFKTQKACYIFELARNQNFANG